MSPRAAFQRSVEAASVAQRSGYFEEAAFHLRKAVALVPHEAALWSDLGVALNHRAAAGRGSRAEAVQAYRRSLSIAPRFVNAYNNMAVAFQAEGDLDSVPAAAP